MAPEKHVQNKLSGHQAEAVAAEANISLRSVERFVAGKKPVGANIERAILAAIVRLSAKAAPDGR